MVDSGVRAHHKLVQIIVSVLLNLADWGGLIRIDINFQLKDRGSTYV